jgi:hypothetical protein
MEFVDGATPSSGGEVTERSSRGISRRSVMKAGAAAAWSVPLVQVVAAAPAFAAASGSGTTLRWVHLSASYEATDATRLDVTVEIANDGGEDATAVQVILQLPSALANATVSVPPPNWAVTGSGTTFAFALQDLAKGATERFNVEFALPNGNGIPFELNATVGAPNAPIVPGTCDVLGASESTVTVTGSGGSGTWSATPSGRDVVLAAAAKNSGPKSISNVRVTVTLNKNTRSAPAINGWTCSPLAAASQYVFTRSAAVLPGTAADLSVTFPFPTGSGNDVSGVAATATQGG